VAADALLDEVLAEAPAALGPVLGAGLAMARLDLETEATVRDLLAEVVARVDRRHGSVLDFTGREDLLQEAIDELFGMGVIQAYAEGPGVTDIVMTGPHDAEVNQEGRWVWFDPGFASEEALEEWGRRLAERHGYHVDHASPAVDFAISNPRGRFHIVIPPVAPTTQVSIRIHGLIGEELEDLARRGTSTRDANNLLGAIVRAKLNVLVTGGGSTGKTTTTNGLCRMIPPEERVVTIEDLAELQLSGHLSKLSTLFTHRANIEGRGERTIEDLIPEALRMCADRIVVGEIRGREAVYVLDIMNTGHEGSITTIHANSASDALERLVTLLGNAGWAYEFAVRRVAQTIAFVVHMRKLAGGARVIDSITEVDGAERTGVIRTNDIFAREGDTLVFRNRPREDHCRRLEEAGWQVPANPVVVGPWR
jgi:pilus assembly protein CpaF